jgi:hypothetical protein
MKDCLFEKMHSCVSVVALDGDEKGLFKKLCQFYLCMVKETQNGAWRN